MRFTASEKFEIIQLAEGSDLPLKMTLEQFSAPRTTFYGWYRCYMENGYDGLLGKGRDCRGPWNRISDQRRQEVVEIALELPEKSSRELAFYIIDYYDWFISESSVYRILKAKGLITILDDYSRFIIAWALCKNMYLEDAKWIVKKVLGITGIPIDNRPRLFSDNGFC